MTRMALALAAAIAATTASAQQTIEEALTEVTVFTCELGAEPQLFVFRTAPDGTVTLIGDPTSPVRATDTGLSVMAATGLREISDGAYHVYNAGTVDSGTCADITAFAHELYPEMTLAYTPTDSSASVAEQAAAASLADLTVRTERAVADMEAARAEFDTLAAARDAAVAELAQTQAERDRFAAELESVAAALAEAVARAETLSNDLATMTADRDEAARMAEALQNDLATAQAKTVELQAELGDTMARLATAETKVAEIEAELADTANALATAEAELSALRTLYETATASAEEMQMKLTTAMDTRDATAADNRNLVATVAGLNGKISELGERLRVARRERDAAQQSTTSARTVVISSSSLTNAAIARLATLQGRSQNAVRTELCRIIGKGRGC